MKATFWPVRIASLAVALAAAFGIQAIGQGIGNSYVLTLICYMGIYVTLAVSLNLINGITGQFSIGHAGFYMVGAYTAGWLGLKVWDHVPWALPLKIIVSMFAAGAVAALMGFVVGLPSLRLKGDYLAIVTMGFGEITRITANNIELFHTSSGFNVTPNSRNFVWLVWLLAFGCIAVCRNLLQNAQGLAFLSVREDEVAANAMGISPTSVKVTAFVLGSMFAGMAGSLYATYDAFILPDKFKAEVSFLILTMVILGGTGSITGSVVASMLLFILPEKLRDLQAVPQSLVLGGFVALIATVVVLRWIKNSYHGKRLVPVLGTIGAGIVLSQILSFILQKVGMSGTLTGESIRPAIFALTLIVLMLLQPQGIFAHHEFSWNWLRSIFSKRSAA